MAGFRLHEWPAGVRSAILLAGMTGLIVYGSLYPFEFHRNQAPGVPFRALLATWRTPPGRGDAAANFLLYFPFGFLAARCFRLAPVARVLLVLAGGVALSTSMELLQSYVAGRFSAMSDVYANAAGTVAGAVAGCLVTGAWENRVFGMLAGCEFQLLVLASWLGFRLYPYVPVIDLHKYWQALRPLATFSSLSLAELYRNAVEWMALGTVVQGFPYLKSRWYLWSFAAGVLFARILMAGAFLSTPEVAGLILGVVAWHLSFGRPSRNTPVLAVLITGLFLVLTVYPSWRHGKPGLLVYAAVPSFFESLFLGGALLWLLRGHFLEKVIKPS